MNHIITVAQYMALELIFGVLIGLISKEIIKLSARKSSGMQIFSSSLETFFTYLFISGFIWGSVVGLLYPLLYRESE